MLASRAIIGMLDVFAMTTVLAASLPPPGSLRLASSVSMSASSLPRSPQPTYTITSASHHFVICCSSTVLPVPNPPGTAQLPPLANGNSTSTTRCPVSSGGPASSRRWYGRGRRTGQDDVMRTSVPATVAITASAGTGPASRTFSTMPPRPGTSSPGGTSTRYPIPPGTATAPKLAPSPRTAPASVSGVNSYSGTASANEQPGSSQA